MTPFLRRRTRVNSADVVTITTSIGNLAASIQQNEIFREQNRIIAGTKMPESLSKSALRVYWPTIASVAISGIVLLFVNRSEVSWKLATICTLAVVVAFVAVYVRNALNKRSLARIATSAPLPTPIAAPSEIVKPTHNVQFVEFKQLDEDYFRAATLVFRNVPNGKLLGKFLTPRLKVAYYDHATGLEIDDFYSVGWWGEEEIVEDISVAGRSAVLAIFTDKWRVGGQDNTLTSRVVEDESTPWDGRRSIELPFGEIRIVAVLFGNYVSSQAVTVTGVLTLGADGTASFSKDV
ncbi:unnamed protein product [Sphagnum balticum]